MTGKTTVASHLPIIGPACGFIRSNLQLTILALAACWLLVAGCRQALRSSIDFIPVYTGARCLLKGCNPYDTAQLDTQYYQSGGLAKDPRRWVRTPPVYPPSTLLVFSPLALLRFPVASMFFSAISGLLLIACVVSVRSMVPQSSRWLVTILGSCYLFSLSTVVHIVGAGQSAGVVISLLILGTLLYLHGRYIPLATILLALSLSLKPQLGIMIVLYLVFKRIYWRQAALAIAGSIILLVIGGCILQSRPVSAHWISDMSAQIIESQKPGLTNDPRPTNPGATGFANLQAVSSVFIADPITYNAVGYVIFLAAMALWVAAAIRRGSGQADHWLALAALSAISLLPIYHRDYDTRLLIIALPAVAIIFRQCRILGSVVIAVALLNIFAASLLRHTLGVLHILFRHRITAQLMPQNKLLFVILLRQESLQMLVLAGCFLAAMFIVRLPAAQE